MTTAYIGIGSNEGDRLAEPGPGHRRAVRRFPRRTSSVPRTPTSPSPRTSPTSRRSPTPSSSIETDLESEQLLELPAAASRTRWAGCAPSRTVRASSTSTSCCSATRRWRATTLTIPHPGLLERDFVVTPLLEIAPRLHLPDGTRVTHEGATVGPGGRRPGADSRPRQAAQRAGARAGLGGRRRERARAGRRRGLGRAAAVPARGARGGRDPVRVGPLRARGDDGPVRHGRRRSSCSCPWATWREPASCSPIVDDRRADLPARSRRRDGRVGDRSGCASIALYCRSPSEAPRGPRPRGCDGEPLRRHHP